MNKKGTKALASATLMSLVLTTALATGNVKAAAGQVTRVGGTDRYETAAKVATANFADGSENVILVNGLSYADSVSASALAKTLNAPILLTTADTLNADAKDALNTLKPKNVYIVGGEAAVSKSVADSLSDYSVTRLSGANRYATNLAVANELVKNHGVSKDNLLVVTGQAYSDALSAAPVAAAKGEILLLSTNDKTAMGDTYDFAKDSNVTVIGTTNSVDAATYSSLNADKRVDGGANRFATNLNILDTFKDDLKADKLYVATAKPNADGANDTQFADALVASAIAGKYSAPLVLTNSDADTDTATNNAISYIGKTATKTTDLQVVGGTGVVSDKLVGKINDAVNPPVTELAISSVDYVNSKKLVINFNKAVDNTDDIEDDANRVVVYPAGNNRNTADNYSDTISFSNDKKTATVILHNEITAGTNYKLDLLDAKVTDDSGVLDTDKLNLANPIVSYTGVLSQGIDVPTATVNDDQDNFVVTYAQKMNDAAQDATNVNTNYKVYDSDNNLIASAFTGATWDDATTKKAVKLKINPIAGFKAGETYKVVVGDAVKADDGTELTSSQKVFKVVTPGVSDAKPVLKVAQASSDSQIVLTFNKTLKESTTPPTTIDKDLVTLKKSSGSKIDLASDPTVSGKTLTLNAASNSFESGKNYTVSIDANAVRNASFTNAANDQITNYTLSTPDNKAVKSLTGNFVQESGDPSKYDVVFTFDQPVQTSLQSSKLLQINALGKTYILADPSKVELYKNDSTGKSLIVKDVKTNFLEDTDNDGIGDGSGLSTDSGTSYELVAPEGAIATATPGSTAVNTSELKATIGGIATATPEIDTVTLKSANEIAVNLKDTANTSALTSSDVSVKGFVKSADGNISTVKALSGSQIKVSASGSTLTITPKDSTVVFATGLTAGADTAPVLTIKENTLKNSNGAVQDNKLLVDSTGKSQEVKADGTTTDIDTNVVTDDAAPELVAAKATPATGLDLIYTENVKFKGIDAINNSEAKQFDLTGSEISETVIPNNATNPNLTTNSITLTFTGTPFVTGNNYSDAKVSYTPNSNYKVQDADSNDAVTVTLTGIFN
ncbi:cell wall-binding repeat-containing protein [Clostridium tyrobutyricum]|uniref:cell wall-binding repeat-containing protein n=1 Tax=Clostridium tyrobutyricum TaxID=1519 RepID=UPI0010AA69C9|nr:cell wall-binding repeat-containing protein [Clostridium tyrobutyricum]QCH26517.1 N-acetylmuramoyl-L-alanine amidase LytC [Clostridium tyrobutyricum]